MPDVDVDRIRDVAKRQDELEDELEHLGRRFEKLQGQVTRSWREDRKRDPVLPELEELEDEDLEETEEETRARVLRMIAERRRQA